ncbi:unnamed protein product [Effrenium voratum]|nr:unnamed protein product [Effrenium voratum]
MSSAEQGALPLKCPELFCKSVWAEEVFVPLLGDQQPHFEKLLRLQQELSTRKTADAMSPRTQEALRPYGIRACPRCKAMIQKQADGLFTGCDKMTCRCGCMFCFQCGQEARGGVARCRCVGAHHAFIPQSVVLENYQGAWGAAPVDMDLTKRSRGRLSPVAVARLQREAKVLAKDPPPLVRVAHRSNQSWHFLLGPGPLDTPFAGGLYWGEMEMPKDYPYDPPLVRFRTPNGRFKVDTWLCRTQLDYHPEGWQPAWTISGLLLALLALLCSDSFTSGMCQPASEVEKRRLAAASHDWNREHREFRELFT